MEQGEGGDRNESKVAWVWVWAGLLGPRTPVACRPLQRNFRSASGGGPCLPLPTVGWATTAHFKEWQNGSPRQVRFQE